MGNLVESARWVARPGQDGAMATTYDLPAALANVPISQGRLETTVYTLTEDELQADSVLPRWTRAHVLTHLARNAESMGRLVEAALRNELGEQYPGGGEARDADIEVGAKRSLSEIIDDVSAGNALVVTAFARMTSQTWSRMVGFRSGPDAASRCAWGRWREVEIHHVDLGLDTYTIEDWPEEFVACHLPYELAQLPYRLPAGTSIRVGGSRFGTGDPIGTVDGPEHGLLAWLFSRNSLAAPHLTSSTGDLPELPPL